MNLAMNDLSSTALLIADNVECIRMLTEHGLLTLLVPKPGNNMAFTRLDTATHWGLAQNTVSPVPREHGYLIFLIPKDAGTFEDAMKFFAECVHGCSVNGDMSMRLIDRAPLCGN